MLWPPVVLSRLQLFSQQDPAHQHDMGHSRAKHKAMTPGNSTTQLHANMRHTCLLNGHGPGSITTSLVTPHPPLALCMAM